MKPTANNLLALEEKDQRIKELEGWKREASLVFTQWHDLLNSLPKDFIYQPALIGTTQANAVGAYIAKQDEVITAFRQENQKLREALTQLVRQADTFGCEGHFWDVARQALGKESA